MKQIINDFINSIDTKIYSRIRASKGDAECRRYLKEHLQKQLFLCSVVGQSEQLRAFKHFLQSEYHLPVSNRMVDEFEQKQSS